MIHIYLDDSGDPGYSKKSTNHYLWGGLSTKNPKKIQKCMYKSRKKCAKIMKKQVEELKYPFPESVYEDALDCILKPEFNFHYSYMVKKDYVIPHKPNILSQSFISNLISNILNGKDTEEEYYINIDKGLPEDIFNELKSRMITKFPNIQNIEQKDSKSHDGVQAAHLIANSVFKRYEHDQKELYDIYSHKIETSIKNPKIIL
jgi:hypothetical protein